MNTYKVHVIALYPGFISYDTIIEAIDDVAAIAQVEQDLLDEWLEDDYQVGCAELLIKVPEAASTKTECPDVYDDIPF